MQNSNPKTSLLIAGKSEPVLVILHFQSRLLLKTPWCISDVGVSRTAALIIFLRKLNQSGLPKCNFRQKSIAFCILIEIIRHISFFEEMIGSH